MRIVIEQKFAVKRKIGGRDADSRDRIAPNFAIARHIERGTIREVEIVGLIGIVANPSDASRLVVEKL